VLQADPFAGRGASQGRRSTALRFTRAELCYSAGAGSSRARFAHLHNFRRLRIRYERYPEIHTALLVLACSILAGDASSQCERVSEASCPASRASPRRLISAGGRSAFGLAGQIVRRLPDRLVQRAPTAGCLLLMVAYAAISITLFAGHHGEALLVVLLSLGGLGLGVQFSALIGHLTTAVPSDYAADISGVSTTGMQIGGAVAVAAFGTLYLGHHPTGAADATHAFAITASAFAAISLLAAAMAHHATGPDGRKAGASSDTGWPRDLTSGEPRASHS